MFLTQLSIGADAGVSCGCDAAPCVVGAVEYLAGAPASLENPVGPAAALAGILITLLVALLRSRVVGAPVERIPARYRVLAPGMLGLVAGLLAYFAGMPPAEALQVALYSGPTAVFAHEAVSEGLLNKRRTRARTVREGDLP